MRLLKGLLSRIEMKEYYPTPEGRKKVKEDTKYFHISNHYFQKKDPLTGVVSTHRIGFTYRKE